MKVPLLSSSIDSLLLLVLTTVRCLQTLANRMMQDTRLLATQLRYLVFI